MPSRLRNEVTPDLVSAIHAAPLSASPKTLSSRSRMSVTQTYLVASQARTKLSREACKADHNLRLLVGHANLLDSLMLNLADAEREQEAWFHESVVEAEEKKSSPPRQHIQWADAIPEEEDSDAESDAGSDSDSEFDEEELYNLPQSARRFRVPPVFPEHEDDETDPEEYHDYEFDDEHALVRTQSHPPELMHDDSDSEDEAMPPSPPSVSMDFVSTKDKAILTTTTTALDRDEASLLIDSSTPMIAAY